MKKIIILFSIVLFSINSFSQENQKWYTNIDEAIAISTKQQKPLFLFFTGSDWCGWCIKLQKEVFKTPEFTAWAKENAVLVELDYPRRTPQDEKIKQQNNDLQQAFGVRGYPTVWFVKPSTKDGKTNFEQLGSTGYVAGGPTAWIDQVSPIVAKYTKDFAMSKAATATTKAEIKPTKKVTKKKKV
jgi:protein disulfide-isomerase